MAVWLKVVLDNPKDNRIPEKQTLYQPSPKM